MEPEYSKEGGKYYESREIDIDEKIRNLQEQKASVLKEIASMNNAVDVIDENLEALEALN